MDRGLPITGGESDPAEVNGIDNGAEQSRIGRCIIGTNADNSYGLMHLNVR